MVNFGSLHPLAETYFATYMISERNLWTEFYMLQANFLTTQVKNVGNQNIIIGVLLKIAINYINTKSWCAKNYIQYTFVDLLNASQSTKLWKLRF